MKLPTLHQPHLSLIADILIPISGISSLGSVSILLPHTWKEEFSIKEGSPWMAGAISFRNHTWGLLHRHNIFSFLHSQIVQ